MIKTADQLLPAANALADASDAAFQRALTALAASKVLLLLQEHAGPLPTVVVTRDEPLYVEVAWVEPSLSIEVTDGRCYLLSADVPVGMVGVEDRTEVTRLVNQAIQLLMRAGAQRPGPQRS